MMLISFQIMTFVRRCALFVSALIYLSFTEGESPRWDLMRQYDYVIECHHAEVHWYNTSYLKIETVEFIKFNRTFKRVLDTSFESYKEIGLDVKVKVQLYKLHGLEYKYFPVTVTLELCPEYFKNSFGFRDLLSNFSNMKPCPLKPGHIYIKHLYFDDTKLPPLMPVGSYKLSSEIFIGKDTLLVSDAFVDVIYKNKLLY